MNDEFNVPLDLVIDDAPTEFHATKASFETLSRSCGQEGSM